MLSARETVTTAYQVFAEAFRAGDPDAIAAMYVEDAEFFVPGMPVIVGKATIRETWKMIVGSGGSGVKVEVREIRESGDLAFDTGVFTGTGPDGNVTNTGKWIVIWQRQTNGEWKILRDFMHWDQAPTV